MRIPLDYYRILGLPIQATAEQLQQAHRDRTLQLPRREFSEVAIAARKQLLDEAYTLLSDPAQRGTYDASFLNRVYEPEPERSEAPNGSTAESVLVASDDLYSPSVEVQDTQLVGALLILLELGEYELVLRLAQPLLNSGNLAFNSGRFGQPDVVRPDIVLTVALAQLELGREQWQQGQYENAATSLEVGYRLLSREELFAGVRGEMQTDLYKLRPYRILELVSLPESHQTQRRQGIALLQEMLQDRGGIDGNGDDQSGLNVDDFLRFIQQLRSYLTAAEQHTLFEAEAGRPSAVATYLAVYALLARGFAYRQPALIRRAKALLLNLGTRQDVYLEQAICALLLGQTEEASRALELSQEFESLAFIREHSQGSPDLLPGLCLYGERWLQNEVFPHFRDLAQQRAALKDYFADPQVQAYLEELPSETEEQGNYANGRHSANLSAAGRAARSLSTRDRQYEQGGVPNFGGGTATLDPVDAAQAPLPTAERVSQLSPEGRLTTGGNRRGGAGGDDGLSMPRLHSLSSMRGRRSLRLDRLLFLIAMGAIGLGLLWLLWSWIASAFNPGPTLQGEQLSIGLDTPPIDIPDINATPSPTAATDPNAPLNADSARAVVQEWLDAKVAAMGSTHDTQKLSQVLTDQALAERQQFADSAKQSGSYDVLSHSGLTVSSVQVSPTDPNQAQVEAAVVESRTPHEGGQPGTPTADRVTVRYSLVKKDGRWRIQSIVPLGSEPAEAATSTSGTSAGTTDPADTTSDTPTAPTVEPTAPATGAPNSTVGPSPIAPTGSTTDPAPVPSPSP